MLLKFTVSLLFIIPFALFSQNKAPTIEVTDSRGLNSILVDCDYPKDANRCFVLDANYTQIFETTSYEVNDIPFINLTGLTNETVITIPKDDAWSAVIPLPFNFCFYTEGYNQLLIGDNGIVSFNTSLALADSPYFAGVIPNASMPTNAIFGAFHDLTNDNNVFGCTDDPITSQNECGEIKTYVTGIAPARTFVISFENLNHFNCETSRSSSQIVIYETSNIIEVHVLEKPINCEPNTTSTDYRKNALVGIQNSDGTNAITPPNRNTSIWATTNEAWRFSPNGASLTTVEWRDENNVFVGTEDELIICPEQSTNYTAYVTYNVCIGPDIIINDNIVIEIDVLYPIAIDNTVEVCDVDSIGTEIIDLTIYESLMVGTQTGLVLSYYNSLSDARTENRPITNPTAYELTNPLEVIYVRLQRGVDCFDVGTLTINLNVIGTSQLPEIVVCDTANDNTEVITLSNYTSQIIGTQKGVNISYHPTPNDANNNTNPISNLTATDGDSVFVRLTLQPDGNCPNVVEIPVYLKPVPIIAPIPITLCSNIAIYDLTAFETQVQVNNTDTLNFSYHLLESEARNNSNAFNPFNTTNPIDPKTYVLNNASQIWVRTFTSSGCIDVFPIDFTYIQGVTVQNDTQVSTGSIFDLTASISDMVADLTGVTYQFYDTLIGAQTQNPANLISDPTAFGVTNPETDVFVVFTNTASGCTTIGNILLERVSFNGFENSDIQICDSANDFEELVTLSIYDDGLIVGYEDFDYMEVTYHMQNSEANNINFTNPISEITITGQTILYARIALVFEGVELDFKVVEVTLELQPTILLNPITDTICDPPFFNEEIHDITQYETSISSEPGAVFNYQNTDGTPINNPKTFKVIGPEQIINVFVTPLVGCPSATTITITFHPRINTTIALLQACDADENNEEFFNLSDALPNTTPNYANYTPTYYPTLAIARAGDPATQIANPENYLVTANTFVYVRLYDPITTCYGTARINLRVIKKPEIISNNIILCDFENDATENIVNLSQFNSQLLGSQTGVVVSYYNSIDDADNQLRPINTATVTPTTVLYTRLSAPANCTTVGAINFTLQAAPLVKNINVTVCDNFINGQENYDLTLSNSDIISDPENHSFRYFTSNTNALNNTGVISSSYLITTVPQTIYVRVTNNTTNCFSIAEMVLNFTFPVAVQDVELTACDDDFNLSEEFDLTSAIPNMLADTTGLTISYYSDELGAQTANAAFLITTPENHNTASETDNVFIRFDATTTGCFSIGKLVLKALATPKLIDSTVEICDTDFDGLYTLNLSSLNPLIIQNQSNLIFTYYTSLPNAENGIDAITNSANYAIPNDNHKIYIHVLNQFGCNSIAAVTIKKRISALVEVVTDTLEVCDNDLNNFAVFDLTSFENRFTTETGANFRYYKTRTDANLQQNAILSPTAYQNATPNLQTVFVRVSVANKCDNMTSFNIKTINIAPPTLTEATFCAGTSVILDPGPDYVSYVWNTSQTTQTIEVATAGTYSIALVDAKGCTDTFDILVTELPLPNAIDQAIKECDYYNEADGIMEFNLNNYTNQLTGSNPNVTTSFYLSQTDLDANNPLNSGFINTTNPQTLMVKIQDNTTKCFSIAQLTLEASFINPDPAMLEVCDELGSEDGFNTFDLTLANADVIANLPTNTQVVYYETYNNAAFQQSPLNTNYQNTNAYSQTIFARVENADGCFGIDEVLLVVNELPNIEDDAQLIYCLNSYPETIQLSGGVVGDSPANYQYLWSHGETTASIQINEIGIYAVNITNAEGCSKSRAITVVPSSIATIERIDIGDATSINTVTVLATGVGDYEYDISGGSTSYQDSNVFTNVIGDIYTVFVRDKNGCGVVSDLISVISIPKFFTPNNDSHHDTWLPKGLSSDFQNNVSIYIYDRYGKLLKQLKPNGMGWDGTFNGALMPTSDYWYTIEFTENFSQKQRQLKGHFTLKR